MPIKKVRILSRKKICKVSSSTLVECRIRVGEQLLTRHSIEHPGCVVIIPEIKPGRFLLVKQYRYSARAFLWEFPAGGIERGENVKAAAARELTEETGFAPSKLTKIVSFFPTPGISEEKMHVFHASGLRPAFAEKDEDEDFELQEFSLSELGELIRRGRIEDGKTLLGYFYMAGRSQRAKR